MILHLLLVGLVAALCGSLGAAIAGREGGGCLRSMALGLVGSAVGTAIGRWSGLPRILTFHDFPVVWAIMGSALFVALVGLLGGEAKKR